MKEFRFIGQAADTLENGRPVEPGEYTGPIDESAPKSEQLINDGLLLEVPNGTADAYAAGDESKISKLTKGVDVTPAASAAPAEATIQTTDNENPGGDNK